MSVQPLSDWERHPFWPFVERQLVEVYGDDRLHWERIDYVYRFCWPRRAH